MSKDSVVKRSVFALCLILASRCLKLLLLGVVWIRTVKLPYSLKCGSFHHLLEMILLLLSQACPTLSLMSTNTQLISWAFSAIWHQRCMVVIASILTLKIMSSISLENHEASPPG